MSNLPPYVSCNRLTSKWSYLVCLTLHVFCDWQRTTSLVFWHCELHIIMINNFELLKTWHCVYVCIDRQTCRCDRVHSSYIQTLRLVILLSMVLVFSTMSHWAWSLYSPPCLTEHGPCILHHLDVRSISAVWQSML